MFFRTKPRSKSVNDESSMDPQKRDDILDFIDQSLQQLEDHNSYEDRYSVCSEDKDKDGKKILDLKTIAKLTCAMRRTKSEKLIKYDEDYDGKNEKVVEKKAQDVKRSKTILDLEKLRSRLGSIGEKDTDDVFDDSESVDFAKI